VASLPVSVHVPIPAVDTTVACEHIKRVVFEEIERSVEYKMVRLGAKYDENAFNMTRQTDTNYYLVAIFAMVKSMQGWWP
jgi:hypothetical protein